MNDGVRTFVISDIHGRPELLLKPLEHGAFVLGVDRLIFAGDAVDRGPRVEECLDLIEEHATEVLVGNHDQAIMLCYPINGQDRANLRFAGRLREKTMRRNSDGSLRVATAFDGALISHAGICSRWEKENASVGGHAERLADRLNELYRDAFRHQLQTGGQSGAPIMSRCGPHRYRPYGPCGHDLLAGHQQVFGHTPIFDLGGRNHVIDQDGMTFRYAVIEDGKVRVETGRAG